MATATIATVRVEADPIVNFRANGETVLGRLTDQNGGGQLRLSAKTMSERDRATE